MLRTLLYALSLLVAVGGIGLMFAPDWIFAMAPKTLAYANVLLILLIRGIGILLLALGYLLCAAARDPARYVAVIDTLIFILLCAAVLNLYGLLALDLGSLYPAGYLVARSVIQLALAIALFVLRPKPVTSHSV